MAHQPGRRSDDDITISGANLHIVNGTNSTAGTVNGKGNLIVGYNEERGSGVNDRSGSHNIVIGTQNNYSSYGGLVAGYENTISGRYSSVSGGFRNTAVEVAAASPGGKQMSLKEITAASPGERAAVP